MSDFVKFYLTPTLAFVLVANPKTYELTRSVLGNWVASQDGLAKTGGLILHAIVFILLVSLLMRVFGSVSYARYGKRAERRAEKANKSFGMGKIFGADKKNM